MASFAPSPSSPSTSEESPPSQQQPLELEQQQQPPAAAKEKECVHRTKTIQFLGRTSPIVLQNDNGPCPLLAICNVLLLRNNLNLSPDISEVSQEKLLSLVADRLIDSNSNVNNKDAGYVENQQQNIADAIDLLPHLATGIDVNLRFRRIDDFEFTRECAVFDLVDIPLYHGWIVDPQDYETANAIGSKSYNALMGELVALETQNLESESKNNTEEDCIDFAAATTATLGVPSPSLSKACSFDESPQSVSDQQLARKGDLEEEAELLRVLRLSESALSTSVSGTDVVDNHEVAVSTGLDKSAFLEGTIPLDHLPTLEGNADVDHGCSSLGNNDDNNNSPTSLELLPGEMPSFPTTGLIDHVDLSPPTVSGAHMCCTDAVEKISDQTFIQINGAPSLSCGKGTVPANGNSMDISEGEKVVVQSTEGEKVVVQSIAICDIPEPVDISKGHESSETSDVSSPILDSDPSSGRMQKTDALDAIASSVDGSEPMYEGEECILDSGATTYEGREPVYEGEVILAEQADKTVRCKEDITPQQGELIRNFLKNNASQLTFYGLFCLQDGLKERELCVFFRNNHFSTMFKYDGELYLLATDQGYINQPDLVWEKLNEVNGDTLFMTGNFKEFKVESHANDPWDENNAMTSTADYLASIDSAAQAGLDINADLQLAIALQQQEFEQQQPPRHQAQQPPLSIGSSRLITGPQVPSRSSAKTSSSSRPEPKSKDKCTVM